jgi:GntR family transcriptional regulator/MocR family aminotransferase
MQRRKAVVAALGVHLGDLLDVVGADAGMHVVALLPPGRNDMAISRSAATQGIAAMPLSTCYLRRPSRGGLVLGYGGANLHQIREGVRKLDVILRT